MRIAHFSRFSPRRSGLYEATRDMMIAEREAGLDPIFIDYTISDPDQHRKDNPGVRLDDDGITPSPWEEAKDVHIWVIHRGIPADLVEEAKRHYTILPIHGGPEHILSADLAEDGSKQTFNTHINLIWNYDKPVSLNKHDHQIWKIYDKDDKMAQVDDAIDLQRFAPEGHAWEFYGEPSIFYGEVSRNIKTPFTLLWAMPGVHKALPNARLELYGLPFSSILTHRNYICRTSDPDVLGTLETVQLVTSDLRPMMRGADIGVNPNLSGVRSRVSMETMACGTPVVATNGDYPIRQYRTYDTVGLERAICVAWEDIRKDQAAAREKARAYAVEHFDVRKTVETGWIPLYEEGMGVSK